MTREEFIEARSAVSDEGTLVIVFTDGERHVVAGWTVDTEQKGYVRYIDIHAKRTSCPLEVSYRLIKAITNHTG